MDRNFILALALSLLVMSLWASWEGSRRRAASPEGDYTAEAPAPDTPFGETQAASEGSETPSPRAAVPETIPLGAQPVVSTAAEQRTTIHTNLYEAELTNRGGSLSSWQLSEYRDANLPGRPPVNLTTTNASGVPELTTPFVGLGLGDLSAAEFEMDRPGPRTVRFSREQQGITIHKSYEFEEVNYTYRLRIEVENRSGNRVQPSFAVLWRAEQMESTDFQDHSLVALHAGSLERARIGRTGGGGFLRRGSGGVDPETFVGEIDWAGADSRYFVAALLPEVPRQASARFEPLLTGKGGVVQIGYTPIDLPSGQTATREYRGYIGPKEGARLEAVGAELGRSINLGYSWMTPLTRFFTWLLGACYTIVPNYGVSIILLTILVRAVTAPLMVKQMRSMKRMGEVQPKLKALQEKYGDDKQRQSQEMMKLYKEEGVNPLGGCLPLLLQFPVFIGLYYALQSSIQLRQAPFFGWIDDLSVPETLFVIPGAEIPFRVLPIVMGVTMILQQKLSPTTMDPAQARMMMFMMPVMFTVLFYTFPSGLVLYWLVSNVLAIAHQSWINRKKQPAV